MQEQGGVQRYPDPPSYNRGGPDTHDPHVPAALPVIHVRGAPLSIITLIKQNSKNNEMSIMKIK